MSYPLYVHLTFIRLSDDDDGRIGNSVSQSRGGGHSSRRRTLTSTRDESLVRQLKVRSAFVVCVCASGRSGILGADIDPVFHSSALKHFSLVRLKLNHVNSNPLDALLSLSASSSA